MRTAREFLVITPKLFAGIAERLIRKMREESFSLELCTGKARAFPRIWFKLMSCLTAPVPK